MPKFHITHVTRYLYQQPINDSANQIMLYPIEDDLQQVLDHQLKITDNPLVETYHDYFENTVGTFTNPGLHAALNINSELVVITHQKNFPQDFMPQKQQWESLDQIKYQLPYLDFLMIQQSPALNAIQEIVDQLKPEKSPLKLAQALSNYIFTEFTYKPGVTTVETTLDEVWDLKSGVCQDFAHLLLVMLKIGGIPARYLSGYICPNKNGMRGEGATHAWVEAYLPDFGWQGLDPTNDVLVNDQHVRLAVGRNFTDCSPVKGTFKGNAQHRLEVSVIVGYEGDKQEETEVKLPPTPVTMPQNQQPVHSKNSYRIYMEQQQQQ